MNTIMEEFGGALVYAIAGGGLIAIFCKLLDMVSAVA